MQGLDSAPFMVSFLEVKLLFQEVSQRWLNKHAICLWRLLLLVLLGIIGMFLCICGVEKQMPYFKSRPSYLVPSERTSCHSGNLSFSSYDRYPQPATYDREECRCTPVQKFVIVSMQRTGSGWFETLLNSHPNVSSHGEVFSNEKRRQNMLMMKKTLDIIYNLDWVSSACKNECTAAVGFKWMLNQQHFDALSSIGFISVQNRSFSIFQEESCFCYLPLSTKHFAAADQLAEYKPLLNLTSLIVYMRRIEEIMLDAELSFNGTRNMVVYYEDLLENPAIENWRDVSKHLHGTKYMSFAH